MLPVFVNLLDFRAVQKKLGDATPKWIQTADSLFVRVLCFAVGVLVLYIDLKNGAFSAGFPYAYMFLTIPLALLYNGERGKANLKYFFYVFYPLHLALLEGILTLQSIL